MGNFHLDNGEQIILESFNAIWISRNSLQLSHFVLTNQKMYCFYKKSNGLLKKSTKEVEEFYLSSVRISCGEAQIFQPKEEKHFLQICFNHGVEKIYFPEMSKKTISQCISKLHEVLDTDSAANEKRTRKKRDGILNSIIKMEGKQLGLKTAAEYISSLKEKHYLLVKSKSIPKSIIPNVFADDFYQYLVYNEEGECVFRADGKRVFDQNMKEVGSVTENLISLRVPLFEKNKKAYTVKFKGEELCQITACISMGSRYIDCSGPVRIDRGQNHFLIEYENKKLAQVYDVLGYLQKGHIDRFVIGYDEPEQGALATLICLAYNLAEINLSGS